MVYKFINRYSEEILFIKKGDTFEMLGGEYYRFLFDVDDNGGFLGYHAVDPSGGPFVSVGMDMGYVHQDLKGLVVNAIEKENDKIILKTKK